MAGRRSTRYPFRPEHWGELGYLGFAASEGWDAKEMAEFLTERRVKLAESSHKKR